MVCVAMAVPGYLRVGRMWVPVYGLFAAVGIVASIWLSQRCAKFVGIAEDKLWDAGMFAVFAAFVASRVLLILGDFRSFLKYPVLMLALPSLTYGGMALTAALVWIYLQWKKLSVLDVMDAWAPCAALLAAILSLGHFVEGTDAGMPTSLPWGVRTAGDSVLGKVHPVQLYAMVAWLCLTCLLLRKLARKAVFRKRVGDVSGVGLLLAGLIAFLLDMLRQPWETHGSAWLDPVQWIALAIFASGIWLLFSKPALKLSRDEAAMILENFVSGGGGAVDHESIEYGEFSDPLLLEIQKKVVFGRMTEEQQREALDDAKRLRENPDDQESEMA